jgi:hypothetical protein
MNARLTPRHLIEVVNGGVNPSSADSDVLVIIERASGAIALLMVGFIVMAHAHSGIYNLSNAGRGTQPHRELRLAPFIEAALLVG